MRFLQAVSLTLGLASCAQLVHSPIEDFDDVSGVPYYQGSYYLLVHTDGKGNLASKLLWLRDPSRKMQAKPTSVFASLESTLQFSNGTLTKSTELADTTAVPTAIIEAAESLLSSGFLSRPDRAPKIALPAPSIYKVIIVDPVTIKFVGEDSRYTVNVTRTSRS